LGMAYINAGDFRQGLEFSRRAVMSLTGELRHSRFGQVTLPPRISRSHIAWGLAELGGFAEGNRLGGETLQTAEEVDQPYSIAFALEWFGFLSRRQGALHRAIPILERGLALSQTADFPVVFSVHAPILGATYALAGRIAEALPLLAQT